MKKNRTYGLMEKFGLFKMIKIMRFTIFILFLSLSQTFAVNTYSQQTKLSLDMRNASIEDVLDRIEKNSEFYFMYNKNMINVDRKIDIQVEEKNVNEVLNKIFANTDVSYLIKDRQILLINSRMDGTGNESIAQQQKSISGKVTDPSGSPLPGVTVVVKGTTTGIITDAQGNYSLSNLPANATLQFSFVGMKSQEITVGNKTSINVTLVEESIGLDEVVAVGYGTQRKADLTGAVSVINVDDLNKQAVANPMKALQGQVPGMYITGNGDPNSQPTIRIRGIGTLNNNDPLYVIDGVPTKAGMQELNPSDIESLQVLKDASSASIYGSRAANGVIIITTKHGKAGGTQVSANAYTSLSSYMSKTKMLDTDGYGKMLWQASINSNFDPNKNGIQYSFDWSIDPKTNQPILNKITIPEFLNAAHTLKASNTNWFNEISQLGVIQNYDAQVSNGTENGNYLLSLGYFDNKGTIKTTQFNRLSVRINTDYNLINNTLKIGQNLSLTKTYNVSASVINAALQALPIIPVRTVDGIGWGGPVSGMNDRQNPVRLLEDNKQNGRDFMRLFGNFFANVNIYKGLTFISNFGVDYGDTYARNWQKKYQSGYLVNNVNRVTNTQSHSLKTTWTNTLNYKLELKENKIDVLAGIEKYTETNNIFMASREGYVIEDSDYMYLDAGTGIKDNSGIGDKHVLLSYFSKANYSLLNKYLLSATLRYDGSSRFGANNRFGTFPSFSAGWRISEEGFIKNNISKIDDLKLRFGWGMTGNQEINNNAIYNIYLSNYNVTSYDINHNGSGVLPSGFYLTQNANPNLRWEATEMSNAGLDFSILNNKIFGSIDTYVKKTSDILLRPPYVGVLGEGGNTWVNGASMKNSGLEFLLGYRNKLGKDLSIDVTGNFDIVRNKVTYLPPAVVNAYGGDGRGQNILGRTFGSFFGYVADGLFRTQEEVNNSATQPGKGLGRIRYSDLNDDKVINDYDRTWIGNPLPKFTYGLNATVNFKNFDLAFLLQGVGPVDVRNEFKFHTDFWSAIESASNKGERLLNAWSPSNTNSDIPAVTLTDNNNEARFSTYFVENGTYLKLRNLQVGYTFNKELLSKFRMKSLRVYIGGDNLGILYKSKSFTGIDPENPGFGYPNPVVTTCGINVRF